MNILHLSDIHIGKGNNHKNFEVLINYINNNYYHENTVILITGDLVDDGFRTQYFQLKKLLDEFNNNFKVFTCPGNHDFGWNGIMADEKNLLIYREILKKQITFPILDIVDDHYFIGLNSMEEEIGLSDRFASQGELGEQQLCQLNYLIEYIKGRNTENKIIVYLHHHPFYYYNYFSLNRLKDHKELKEVIEGINEIGDRVNMLLFGHKHVQRRFNGTDVDPRYIENANKEEKYRINLICAAGSSTEIQRGTAGETMDQPVLRFMKINSEDYSNNLIEVPC